MIENFDPLARAILVRVRLFGPEGAGQATLALDTGATTTLLDPRLLVLIGCDPAKSDTHVFITGATSVTYVPKVTIDALEALGARRAQMPVLSMSLPPSAGVDGLLGLDFFRNARLTIDFRNGRLSVR